MILIKRSNRFSGSLLKETVPRIVFENSSITKRLWMKQIKLQSALLTLNILSLLVSVSLFDMKHTSDVNKIFSLKDFLGILQTTDLFYILSSVIAFATIALSVYHRVTCVKIDFYKGKTTGSTWKSVMTGSVFFYLNLLLYSTHPNLIFEKFEILNERNTFQIYNSNAGDYVDYSINDILCLFSLIKIVSIFNILINCINYNSDVADRIWYVHKQDKWLREERWLRAQMPVQAKPDPPSDDRLRHQSVHFRLRYPNLRVPSVCVG